MNSAIPRQETQTEINMDGKANNNNCDAYTVVCVACVFAELVWWCKIDCNAGVDDGCGVANAGRVGGTRDSGMSSAADVIWTSVVREMRGVGGVCEMCTYSSGRCG